MIRKTKTYIGIYIFCRKKPDWITEGVTNWKRIKRTEAKKHFLIHKESSIIVIFYERRTKENKLISLSVSEGQTNSERSFVPKNREKNQGTIRINFPPFLYRLQICNMSIWTQERIKRGAVIEEPRSKFKYI